MMSSTFSKKKERSATTTATPHADQIAFSPRAQSDHRTGLVVVEVAGRELDAESIPSGLISPRQVSWIGREMLVSIC
ncbi:hypothetical protein GUJ93_ZPchr0006g41442 [Zizania palustris]|uniref:Uncharacterized protein n=1 Tax=Zizania palustris TaxID=103762 RepID=A0A8J5VQS9_ZIZPA|nr:hypothetical protein GUJ93_ZPchr0006g41442 [Zizania palustris]